MTNTIKDKIIAFMVIKKALQDIGVSEEDAGIETIKYLSNFRETMNFDKCQVEYRNACKGFRKAMNEQR